MGLLLTHANSLIKIIARRMDMLGYTVLAFLLGTLAKTITNESDVLAIYGCLHQ